MTDTTIYSDIALRTDGAFMLGIVGPVRTGKSTFIKRFMELLVIPHIENTYMKERARDELPQSGSGKTIMTAEPKFVPENAVTVQLIKFFGALRRFLLQLFLQSLLLSARHILHIGGDLRIKLLAFVG